MQRTKVKFSDSPCQNILRLCNILVQVRFKAKKTNLDIQYSKLGIRDTSRVAEQLKTRSSEIKSYQENPKFVCRNKSLAIVVKKKKKYAKKGIKLFLPCQIFMDFSNLFQILCPGFYFLKICNYKTFEIYIDLSLILQSSQRKFVYQFSKILLFTNLLANKTIFRYFRSF